MASINAAPLALLETSALARATPSSAPSLSSSISSLSSLKPLPLLHNRPALSHSRRSLPPTSSSSSSSASSSSSRGNLIKVSAVAAPPTPSTRKAEPWNGPYSSESEIETDILPPSWSILGDEISTGPCPRSPRDLNLLIEHTHATAFVFLETEEGCAKLGLDWSKFRERAAEFGLVAIKISMRDGDYQDQAAALPEAVRAVATLAELGYKVHISCTSGVERSPLVALGYLSFIKGLEFTDAVEVISDNNPAAEPHFEAWEEAKTRMSAGDLKRVSALAHEVSQRRMASRQQGTPADDWLTAQQLLVSEAFERGVATDISLSEAVAKVESMNTNKEALTELAIHKANAERAMAAANASKEKIDFFARQLQSLKEKEDQARVQAVSAFREKENLLRQVETLKMSSQFTEKTKEELRVATDMVKQSAMREEEYKKTITEQSEKVKELTFGLDRLRHAEASARKEAQQANARLEMVTEKLRSMDNSLTDARKAKETANKQVKDLLDQIRQASSSAMDAKAMATRLAELSVKETTASSVANAAQERIDFLQRQVVALKERESSSLDHSRISNLKLIKLTEEVENARLQEAAAKEQVLTLERQLAQMSEKVKALESRPVAQTTTVEKFETSKNDVEIKKLMEELSVVQKREAKAVEAEKFSKDQIEFLQRRIESLKEREEKAVREMQRKMETFQAEVLLKAQRVVEEKTKKSLEEMTKKLESAQKVSSKAIEETNVSKEKVEFFYRRLELVKGREEKAKKDMEERIRVFTSQVSLLRERLKDADVRAEEADKKILSLSTQVKELEDKEKAFQEAAKAAGLRVEFFFRHIESLKEKEREAKRAVEEANEKTRALRRKVLDLERREGEAARIANERRSKMVEMNEVNMELAEELQQVKEREKMLVSALEDGTGILKIAMQADETVKRLRDEATKSASELQEARNKADRLAAELEQALKAGGKKSSFWNRSGTGSGPSDVEQQLVSKMSSLQTAMAASGTATVTGSGAASAALPAPETPESEVLKTLILGALGVAAVPFTLMSMLTGQSGNPNVIAAMNQASPAAPVVQEGAGEKVEDILSGPLAEGISPKEFCIQVPRGLRSARTDKFCNSILEAASESATAVSLAQ